MKIERKPVDFKVQCASFSILLKRCLDLQENDDLLVIYDESLKDFEEALLSVIETDAVSATFVCIPKSYQKCLVRAASSGKVQDKIDLPSGIVSAVSTSTAILNLLDGDPENAALRRTINHTSRLKMCRLATIPGISSEIIQTILQSPIDEILRDCELVAWILGESQTAELISYDSHNRSYKLGLQLNGWDNEPIMSPGILLPGSWGNVPPGETFCCPKYESVNGEICINGSLPRHVLHAGEEVILRFEKGKLVSWRMAEDSSESNGTDPLSFFENEKSRAQMNNDPNWNTFAELGIGLNPIISELTGNSLFDEKAKQTLHIAIGDNSNFGDDVVSYLHADLVTWRPDLRLDGKDIMVRGDIRMDHIEKLWNNQAYYADVPANASIRLRDAKVDSHHGVLKRRLSKAHRVNYVTMANEDTSRQLDRLCQILANYDTIVVNEFIEQYPDFDGIPTIELLEILNHYRVLQITATEVV